MSFLAPLPMKRALDFWRTSIETSDTRSVFLVARDADEILGTAQLHPAWAPNQPYRAEVSKLLVHRRARRRGVGRALMRAIEDQALVGGFRLLTLDAKRGTPAEALYRKLGWTEVGTIPEFALDPDGVTPHDAVVFYKHLSVVVRLRS